MRVIVLLISVGVIVLFLFAFQLFSQDTPSQPRAAEIKTTLDGPLIRGSDPTRGSSTAPLVLTEFSDFACRACQMIQPVLSSIEKKFPGKILRVWKDFPLPQHFATKKAHEAARCAGAQNKFWEYHDRLFVKTPTPSENYIAIARAESLDARSFAECLDSGTMEKAVAEDVLEGQLLGVDQTPYLFLNNKRIPGFIDEATLTRMITETLP